MNNKTINTTTTAPTAEMALPISEIKNNTPSQQISNKKKTLFRKNDPNTRYDENGTRYQSVAIPFRYTNNPKQPVELLMITSRRLGDLVFCGGGWEKTETGSEAALREAKEEAGILGEIICELYSDHNYISDKQHSSRVWFFLMQVSSELDVWDENAERERKWVSIDDADAGLGEKRRAKFHNAWVECMKWFITHDLYTPTKITGLQIEKYDGLSDKQRIAFTADEVYNNANASSFNKTVFLQSSNVANTSVINTYVSVDVNHNNKNVSSAIVSNGTKTSAIADYF